jgi:hypothetical protein
VLWLLDFRTLLYIDIKVFPHVTPCSFSGTPRLETEGYFIVFFVHSEDKQPVGRWDVKPLRLEEVTAYVEVAGRV